MTYVAPVLKVRKKPVTVEAMFVGAYTEMLPPWTSREGVPHVGDIWKWVTENGGTLTIHDDPDGRAFGLIETLEGRMRVDIGNYVIRGVKGEFYPCRRDVFDETYEPVDDRIRTIAAD